jgi:type IV pilus assembly protein PilZ
MDDKRQHTRIPVALKVAFGSRDDLQRHLVTDLSPGGLFVRTSKPLPIGTEVDLEVTIAETDLPMHIRGKVVWLRQKHGPEGMGIQFTGIMGEVLAELVGTK